MAAAIAIIRPDQRMRLLLDLFYLLGIVVISPWLLYRRVVESAKPAESRVGERLGADLGDPLAASVWLHGSSVGEVSLLKPLVRKLQAERPDLPLVITSHTAAGVVAARRAYPSQHVRRFPFDISFVHERWLDWCRPRAIVVVESDLWPNHLLAAARREIPVAVVNAKLSEKSYQRHRRFKIVARAMQHVALIAAQTDEHAERFAGLGIARERIRVTGNMKYDTTSDPAEANVRTELRNALGFADDDVVVIGGSLHPKEDVDLLASHAELLSRGISHRLIIVPRYPDQRDVVLAHAVELGFSAVAKTVLDADPARQLGADGVLVVDTLGELGRFYAAADIAFVGGSLYYRGANKGGHNLMEPAILGLPVLFGPYNFSFKETVADLLAKDAGLLVRDRAELVDALAGLITSREQRAALGQRARRVVIDGQGASQRNLALLLPLIDGGPGCSGVS
ncbi:MAG: 3-deoxy-D-manno-octulosonic acid transferase [Gammaproteobacteria bacterium]|nr:3-deoxy-D-manno-octulosonic acid transferase [Gammaproteobacteria bacterium]